MDEQKLPDDFKAMITESFNDCCKMIIEEGHEREDYEYCEQIIRITISYLNKSRQKHWKIRNVN